LQIRVRFVCAEHLTLTHFYCRIWSCGARGASKVIKFVAMSTASARPQLQIRQALEDDTSSLCEIFNEAVQDHLETFESEPRSVDEQRLRIAAAEQDPKHPILVAELRSWIAGWAALAPYDNRIALDDIGEVYIYVRRAFRSYGVGRQLMRAIQEAAGKLGYRKLIGRVLAQNQDGLVLCRATGWRDVGRLSAHARLNDGLHDVMLVEYLIPSTSASIPAPPTASSPPLP
jgi:L-amino acid N-acyltransferase YncA